MAEPTDPTAPPGVLVVHVPCYYCEATGHSTEPKCAMDIDGNGLTLLVRQPCRVCGGRRWFDSWIPVRRRSVTEP